MAQGSRTDWMIVGAAVCVSAGLGFSNLSVPSLWHDEMVHVFVGKSIAEGQSPQLPSGEPYYSGTVWNVLLGGVIRVFGVNEISVRSPAVIIGAVNVALTYLVMLPLLGRGTALAAAVCVALSPWTVAWAREARFYALQQSFYLLTVYGFYRVTQAVPRAVALRWSGFTIAVYALGVLTSFHSILFLSGIGLFAGLMLVQDSANWRRWFGTCAAIGVTGLLTIGSYFVLMNSLDREAVFDRGGLGGSIVDPERALRSYYLHWLWTNHSVGFFALAIAGFGLMAYRRKPETLLPLLAFWGPILMLTYFIGYRQFRFMFFAFPFYLAAVAYGAIALVAWLRTRPVNRMAWIPRLAAAGFLLRCSISAATLIGDSLEAAGGAHTTLARRHPRWREPCLYVRERAEDAAILTTTYLPVLHYVGRVDNWYPNQFLWWEADESGMHGISDRCELEAFMQEHPRGYYIADRWRFDFGPWTHRFSEWMSEAEWVKQTMRRVDEACSEDVSVYAWGPL